MKKGEFSWVDKGRGVCNAVFVGNVVDLALICLIHSKADKEAFIATDGEVGTWYDFFSPLMRLMGMNPNDFPSIPLKDGLWRSFRLAWKNHLLRLNAFLCKQIDKIEKTNPMKAKLLYRMPRRLLRAIRNVVTYRLPIMDATQMAIYCQNKAIDAKKNFDLLDFVPRYSVKKGQEITINWLSFSDLYLK